tara:strand:+ start:965 stop:1201 length:237 start_codon:yes stop_codon:yes gene_type:complete
MKGKIIQEIKELKEKVWTQYQEDSFGYDNWFDHLESVDGVDDILNTISKWDFDDSDNAVFYYTKITTLENVLYDMEEE